jgi:hypothetical protein
MLGLFIVQIIANLKSHLKMSGWLKHHSEHITREHNTLFVGGLIGMVSLEFRMFQKVVLVARMYGVYN